jgi:tetratricopeptide (TPR) repeat protein
MNKLILVFMTFVFAAGAAAQAVPAGFDLTNYGVRIEPDRRVLVVLATLDAARTPDNARLVNTKLTPAGETFRTKLESELTVPDDLRQKISTFLTQYRKRRPNLTDAEAVAPFVAMAYSLSPPPDLGDPVITTDLPGDLLDVLDFAPLVREFYRRSGIAAKLDEYVKADQTTDDARLRSSAREMVSELLDYLHTKPQTVYAERVKTETAKSKSKTTTLQQTEIREHERRFVVVPLSLAPAGNVQFLNIRDDYYVIVPPDTDLSVSETRRAFLQYVVDGMILRNAKDVAAVLPGVKQLLEERRKTDPNISRDAYLAVSRSLVAAVDTRQTEYARVNSATYLARQKLATLKTDEEKRAVTTELEKFKQAQADESALRLSEDYEKGAVLAFYFAQQLRGMEDAGFDIAASMRDILLSFDAAKEANRIAEFAEARRRAVATREARKANPKMVELPVAENPVTTRLREIQETIAAKNYAKAKTDLDELAKTNPSDPRIYYNLGRVATLELEGVTDEDVQARKLIEAKNAYAKVLQTTTSSTDKALLSLTYVALARIYEFYNDKDTSVKLYDKAIELTDVPGGAYSQAIAGKQRLLKNP